MTRHVLIGLPASRASVANTAKAGHQEPATVRQLQRELLDQHFRPLIRQDADVLRPDLLSRAYGLDIDRLDRPGKTPVVFPNL